MRWSIKERQKVLWSLEVLKSESDGGSNGSAAVVTSLVFLKNRVYAWRLVLSITESVNHELETPVFQTSLRLREKLMNKPQDEERKDETKAHGDPYLRILRSTRYK